MVKIVEYGDRISTGRYNFHSRFRNHINFVSGSRLLTLTDKPQDAGPVNIVLNSIAFSDPLELTIQHTKMICSNSTLDLTQIRKYSSDLQLGSNKFPNLEKNLDLLTKLIIENGSVNSLKHLLYEKQATTDKTFKDILYNSIKGGVDLLFSGNISEGVRQIKGKGYGLTPSGDDFITGLLYALHILQLQGFELSRLRKEIHENSTTSNQISGTYISLAKEGRYFADLKKLIYILSDGTIHEIRQGVQIFLSKGETSGADLLTGFVLGLKNSKKLLSFN